MKELYVISLDDDIPLQSNIANDIRQIAYFLYDELDRYDRHILCIDDDNSLIRNELYEVYLNSNDTQCTYKFTSDKSSIDYRHYEPFMIDDRSFGFTIYEGSLTTDEIVSSLNTVLFFLHLNKEKYQFNISSIKYNTFDERMKIIADIAQTNLKNNVKKRKKTFKPILPILQFR